MFAEKDHADTGAGSETGRAGNVAPDHEERTLVESQVAGGQSNPVGADDLLASRQALEQASIAAGEMDINRSRRGNPLDRRQERSHSGLPLSSNSPDGSGTRLLNQRLSEARRQALQADRDRKAAEKRARRFELEAKELRGKMDEYVGQLHSVSDGDGEALDALRAELELVRYQAALDLDKLRGELEEARIQAGMAVIDQRVETQGASEQQISALQAAVDERERELALLRDEMGSLTEKHREAESALKQAQQSCLDLNRELEVGRAGSLVDERVKRPPRALDPRHWLGGESTWKRLTIGVSIGALLMVALLAWLLVSGRGEFVTTALRQGVETLSAMLSSTQDNSLVSGSAGSLPHQKRLNSGTPEPGRQEGLSAARGGQPSLESSGLVGRTQQDTTGKQGFVKVTLRDRLADSGWGPRMVRIPATRFTMGRRQKDLFPDEKPAHPVSLNSYYISQYETTFEAYDRFARATGWPLPDDQGWGRGRRPVINVTWEDARDYAGWLSEQSGQTYRLPSEAEWEYAASGGSDNFYWWSDQLGSNRAVCFNCGSDWDGRSTASTGSLSPNRFGLYNTAGNVMEWVADCYHVDYQGAPADGRAWVEPGCSFRVARGGAFSRPAEKLRTTSRTSLDAKVGLSMLGFRLVREP